MGIKFDRIVLQANVVAPEKQLHDE